jgi:4-amino-4-deoxy-L-arabinose transferase-like glycosyltransferase
VLFFAPWLIYMGLRFGPDFFQVYFSYSDVSRIVSPLEGHAEGVFYYFTYLAQNENTLWVVLLPFAAGLSVVKAVFKRSNVDALLIVWMGVVLLFFTVAQTRIYWYILPAFPAFAIAVASLLYQVGKKILGRYTKKTPL